MADYTHFEEILADPSYDAGPITLRLCDDGGTVRSGLFHSGTDYPCTGSAHHGRARLICTNQIHRGQPMNSPSIDAAHLENQRAWSAATFGPGPRIEHIEDH